MKQKRFYSYALATSLLISSFGGLVNVSAATYQDAEEVKAQEHVSIMKMDASASDLFLYRKVRLWLLSKRKIAHIKVGRANR